MTIVTLIVWVFAAIGACSVVAAFTPNESDNAYLQRLWDFINLIGANVYKAVNK
jgi:hypothetical protein